MSLVTVVVPAFNAQRFIERAIRSLQAQTLPHWVCVIVDDGSTDRTQEIAHGAARTDSRITFITQKNSGPAAARNTGASAAQTPYILFLDADDELEAEALEILTAHLEEDGLACAAYCAGNFIDEGGTLFAAGKIEAWARSRFQVGAHGIETVKGQRTGFASFVFECRIMTPGMVLIRTEAFRAVGGFDEDPRLTIREDWDLWIRLSRSTPMRFVDLPLARYRRHDSNISGADIQAGLATWRLRMKTINSPCNRAGQRRLALSAARLHYRGLVRSRLAEAIADLRHRRWSIAAVGIIRIGVDVALLTTFSDVGVRAVAIVKRRQTKPLPRMTEGR